jgi:acetylornithine deacetylase/succinyl-diaminopimelate desuccinylase-like protein
MELMLMLMIKRAGKPLARDIIFMANADEEAGGNLGAGWMVEHHPDLIRAEYAINEGAGIAIDILGQRFFPVQTGEKGTARFVMRTYGRPGHGAQPHSDNAVLKLASAIQIIGAAELPLHTTQTVCDFFEGIATRVDKKYQPGIRALLNAKTYRAALMQLPIEDGLRTMVNAMLHNTVTPTMLNAGTKVNVIPSFAEARCDARLIPGQSPDDLLHELRALIGNEPAIEFEATRMGRESEHHTPLFETITRVMAKHQPHATVLPFLVTGATDARHLTKLGTQVYGFCPMIVPLDEQDTVHAHNERVSIDNLEFGTRVLYDVISEFCEQS